MFSQACVKNSVHMGGGVSTSLHAGIHPPPAATAADSTHPTGMHSLISDLDEQEWKIYSYHSGWLGRIFNVYILF